LGAVYVVPTPLSVWGVLNEPQSLEPQLAVQLAPSVFTSFVITALTFVVPPTASDVGTLDNATAINGFTIVIVTLDCCDGSLVTLAVRVTVTFAGIAPGAV
jgi:hypothetical protein